jgi:hypothetical protein
MLQFDSYDCLAAHGNKINLTWHSVNPLAVVFDCSQMLVHYHLILVHLKNLHLL